MLILILLAAVWLIKTPAPLNTADAGGEKVGIQWELTELGEHAAAPGVPRTGVVLVSGGKRYPAGTFDGSCAEIDGTSWPPYEGEKSGVICWWAGGGSDIGVFEEGGKLVLKVGSLDEGSAEVPAFRGDFRTIATIE